MTPPPGDPVPADAAHRTAPIPRRAIALAGGVALACAAAALALGVELERTRLALRAEGVLELGERLDRLGLALLFAAAGFVLAGLALAALLWRASARVARLALDVRAAQRQLETAHDELTGTDIARRGQTRFLAQVTHDLRQPLQAVQYYLAALEPHVPGAAGRETLARTVGTAAAAQRQLAELLDLSTLDAGALEARRAPTHLGELLGRLHDAARPRAAARGLELDVARPALVVDTDASLLERILGNLLSNALAHTHEGGVRIGVERPAGVPGRVVVGVADTGVGIPAHEREAVFAEYYRISGPEPDAGPGRGVGIGLAIVRRLTRLLDIPVRVDVEPGGGTRFELTLPLVAGAAGSAGPPADPAALVEPVRRDAATVARTPPPGADRPCSCC